jgi:AraC family transcriptional regulator
MLGRIGEQITGIVGGQILPATNFPLLTSAATSWSGFLLEMHDAGTRQDVKWGWHRTHVSLLTEGQLNFRLVNPRRNQHFVAKAGSTSVFPAGFEETHFSIAGSRFQAICVELDPVLLKKLLDPENPACAHLVSPQIVSENAHIAALLRAMALEVAQGCPAGALYSQSLSLALASYLTATSKVKKIKERQFSQSQIRVITDHIHENLDNNLSLCDLSYLVHLSPRQFLRLFSNTFGNTPHQYIMKHRVARAMELLSDGRVLTEIAAAAGFASQSHLCTVFRRVTGISPGDFRMRVARRFSTRARNYG